MSRQDILPAMTAEAPALLRSVEEGLLALEIGESAREASRSVFRSLHSVWAGASLAGMENLGRLSGRMELTLRLLLMDELAPRQHLVDALLQAADLLATMLTHLPEAETVETGGCLRALEAALSAELPPELVERLKPIPVPNHPYWLAAPWLMDSVLEQEYGLFKVILSKQAQQSGHTLYAHLGELLTLGQLLACAPDAGQRLELLYASPLETALLGEALSLPREYLLPLQVSGQSTSEAEPELVDEQASSFSPARIQAPLGPASAHTAAMPFQDKTSPPDSGEALERREHYLVFHLGGETYGVEVSPVREIINLPPLTPLPLSPDFVLGVMNLEGAVAPVFDLRLKLGLPPVTGMGEPVVVVVHLEDKVHGVVVDAVDDVLGLGSGDIQEPPEMAGPVRGDCLTGLVHRDGLMIILVDLACLLAQGPVDHAA